MEKRPLRRLYLAIRFPFDSFMKIRMVTKLLTALDIVVESAHYSSNDKNEKPNYLDSGVQFIAEDLLEKAGYDPDPVAIRIVTDDVINGGDLSLENYIRSDIHAILDDRKIELSKFKRKEE